MHVRFRIFRSSFSSWESLFQEAADFAGTLAPDRLINISHDCDPAREGTVCVWYRDDEAGKSEAE
jgi:hypothetical protein